MLQISIQMAGGEFLEDGEGIIKKQEQKKKTYASYTSKQFILF